MEYKREVKFVFYLWGMLLIISIILSKVFLKDEFSSIGLKLFILFK